MIRFTIAIIFAIFWCVICALVINSLNTTEFIRFSLAVLGALICSILVILIVGEYDR